MKAYFALNEGGTNGDIALHTKLAVLTAKQNTDLRLNLLYTGERNAFTTWLENNGVRVIDSHLPYLPLLKDLTAQGKYHLHSVGHWLRTNVPLEEKDDQFILYTDIDVLFQGTMPLLHHPDFFAVAPEFRPDGWNYFNAGVMFINVEAMSRTYPDFEIYLRNNISEKTINFHDQIAYNEYYRGRWDRLPVSLNWKPYWGVNETAPIVHFHGPKLGAINAILSNEWDWNNNHGVQIGSLFAANLSSYLWYIKRLEMIPGLPDVDQEFIHSVVSKMNNALEVVANKPVDLSFTGYKMFPE